MRIVLAALVLLCACATQNPPPEQNPLEHGIEWRLKTDDGGPARTLSFGPTGALGTAGCNRWFGGLATDAPLRFEPIGSTKMACPPPIMSLESAFLAMLQDVRDARREGEELVLLDGSGMAIAHFERNR